MDQDLELMLGVRKGDPDSFGQLLSRHRGPVVSYVYRLVRDRALAEDLAQEVFLRVYQARHRWKPEARFSAWLYRIATNLALNALRDRKRIAAPAAQADDETEDETSRLPDPNPLVEARMLAAEREAAIRRAVESLPEKQRAAVLLHKYQDEDYRQIARVLGVSESAVKSLLFRAYESLRLRLEPLVKEGL